MVLVHWIAPASLPVVSSTMNLARATSISPLRQNRRLCASPAVGGRIATLPYPDRRCYVASRKQSQAQGGIDRSGNSGKELRMFSHVMIGTNDLDKAKSFYDALLGTLGVPPGRVDRYRIFYRTKTGTFSVTKPIDGKPATPANGGTIGFAAASVEQADAWHAAGLAHGGKTCEEPPGIREGGGVKLYIAYLRDPDGNKLCALHRVE
jgi:catechol 2,3-dioxygenase-like lactoylglutathione lyase family enzyme